MNNVSETVLKVLSFAVGWIIFSVVLGTLNFLISSYIDYSIADRLGAIQRIPNGGSTFDGGKIFGGIYWTVSSLIGPTLSLLGSAGLIASFLLTGLLVWLIVWRIISGTNYVFGKFNWIVFANLAVWILRFPVPTEYSLFYWIAIKY